MREIFLAVCLDLLAGDPYWYPHPVRFMGTAISFYEKTIQCFVKSEAGFKTAGFFLAAGLPSITFFLTAFLLWAAHFLHLEVAVKVILLWNCLALRCLDKEIVKLHHILKTGGLLDARKQLSYLVGRDTDSLDENGIRRAAIETGAENASDGVIAPLFFMLLGGAPLAMAYKAINTMDSMVGYDNERYHSLGFFPAKLDDAANYIPARITAYAFLIWSFLRGWDYKNGYSILKRDGGKSKSPNSGRPEAAVAGILGVRLLGPAYYFGKLVHKDYIGEGTRALTDKDIDKTRELMYGAAAIVLLLGAAAKAFI